jgi:hypothetical protein
MEEAPPCSAKLAGRRSAHLSSEHGRVRIMAEYFGVLVLLVLVFGVLAVAWLSSR